MTFFQFNHYEHKSLIYEILITQAKLTGYLILQLIIVALTQYIIFSIPIPKKWLLLWENSNDITPAMGRLITQHFRYHRYINTYELKYIIFISQIQTYLVQVHHKNENLLPLFEKYDPYYKQDI